MFDGILVLKIIVLKCTLCNYPFMKNTVSVLFRSASCTAVVSPLGPSMSSTHVSFNKAKK